MRGLGIATEKNNQDRKWGASDLTGLQFLLRLSSLSKPTQFHGKPVGVIFP